jgi:hypothetical protein
LLVSTLVSMGMKWGLRDATSGPGKFLHPPIAIHTHSQSKLVALAKTI